MPTIDVHNHIFTQDMMDAMRREAPSLGLEMLPIDGDFSVLKIADITYQPCPRKIWDVEQRLSDMEAMAVDMQVLSNTPQTFLYEEEPRLTLATSAIQNDAMASLVGSHPERFRALATVPLQDAEMAAAELRRAMTELGLNGAHIGTHVRGQNLDAPDLEPFWREANTLRAMIVVHPHRVTAMQRLARYHLFNMVGNPLETTIAIASLVFGGVIERFPDINFVFVHGGGFAPYQAARWEHGWAQRDEPKVAMSGSPLQSLSRVFWDTILYDDQTLRFLIDRFGADRVVLGSDYPFDMGNYEGVRQLQKLGIGEDARDRILRSNAASLLGAIF